MSQASESNPSSAHGGGPDLRGSVMPDQDLLEFVPGAVYVCDLDGVVVRYNRRAGELWGRSPVPGDPKELYCGSHRLYRASGELMPHAETPMVDALREGNSYRNLEVQVEQPSGRRIWILVNIDPLRDPQGGIVGVINCFQDITDRKLADMRQALLVNELNHRVKNTLATVQAIAAHSLRDGASEETRKGFESRLMALSKAHDVLTAQNWEGADVDVMVAGVVAPFRSETRDRFELDGPSIYVQPGLALSLAIALHELCTNAAKYGSLSPDGDGTVQLSWATIKSASGRSLKLDWVERGGPPVSVPDHRGFGSRVLERTLRREHDAEVKLDFAASGVCYTVEVPLREDA